MTDFPDSLVEKAAKGARDGIDQLTILLRLRAELEFVGRVVAQAVLEAIDLREERLSSSALGLSRPGWYRHFVTEWEEVTDGE